MAPLRNGTPAPGRNGQWAPGLVRVRISPLVYITYIMRRGFRTRTLDIGTPAHRAAPQHRTLHRSTAPPLHPAPRCTAAPHPAAPQHPAAPTRRSTPPGTPHGPTGPPMGVSESRRHGGGGVTCGGLPYAYPEKRHFRDAAAYTRPIHAPYAPHTSPICAFMRLYAPLCARPLV